jgi:hypothetical protein
MKNRLRKSAGKTANLKAALSPSTGESGIRREGSGG